MSPLNKRRWENFKKNKRAYFSLFIFCFVFLISIFAEFIANDKPLLIYHNNEFYSPMRKNLGEKGKFISDDQITELNQIYLAPHQLAIKA